MPPCRVLIRKRTFRKRALPATQRYPVRMAISVTHEEGLVRSFIQKNKQERYLSFLTSPQHRRNFTAELAHFKWLDERFAQPIPACTAHTLQEIAKLLRKNGASGNVWVISRTPPSTVRSATLKKRCGTYGAGA
jgi:hypothetical protein